MRGIIEEDIYHVQYTIIALVNLCDLLLIELNISNDLEILNEINPIITKLLKIAEDQHSYYYLVETKLLQAKLALIQIHMDDTRKYLLEAQKLADDYDLKLLAHKISNEHDILLEQLDLWEDLKKKKAPISERMKYASLDGIMARMIGKRTIQALKIETAQSVLLLIIREGGIPLFINSFLINAKFDKNLLGGFLNALSLLGSELFSEFINRINFKNHIILMKWLEPFQICYIVKGRSYSAQIKLNKFVGAIKKAPKIWDALKKSIKTGMILTTEQFPNLRLLISEIFLLNDIEK